MNLHDITTKFLNDISELIKQEIELIRKKEREKLENSLDKKNKALRWAENEINKHKIRFSDLHTRFENMQKNALLTQVKLNENFSLNNKLRRRIDNLEKFGKGKNEKTKVESPQSKTDKKKIKKTKGKSS